MMPEFRYIYFVAVSLQVDNEFRVHNGQIDVSRRITMLEDVTPMADRFADVLAEKFPHWDRLFPSWRNTVVTLGFSLLRTEYKVNGEWVIDE